MTLRRMAVLGTAVVIAGSLALAFSAPAGADTGYPGTTTVTTNPGGSSPSGPTNPSGPTDPCVISPTSCTPAGTHSPATAGSSGSGGTSGTLAFTGADLLVLILGALFLLAVGTVLVVFTRRRANQQQVA